MNFYIKRKDEIILDIPLIFFLKEIRYVFKINYQTLITLHRFEIELHQLESSFMEEY